MILWAWEQKPTPRTYEKLELFIELLSGEGAGIAQSV
jgi:hypothetical protein